MAFEQADENYKCIEYPERNKFEQDQIANQYDKFDDCVDLPIIINTLHIINKKEFQPVYYSADNSIILFSELNSNSYRGNFFFNFKYSTSNKALKNIQSTVLLI